MKFTVTKLYDYEPVGQGVQRTDIGKFHCCAQWKIRETWKPYPKFAVIKFDHVISHACTTLESAKDFIAALAALEQ